MIYAVLDIKTQYIVIELSTTSKLSLKKIHHTLQTVLSNFNDRCNVYVLFIELKIYLSNIQANMLANFYSYTFGI